MREPTLTTRPPMMAGSILTSSSMDLPPETWRSASLSDSRCASRQRSRRRSPRRASRPWPRPRARRSRRSCRARRRAGAWSPQACRKLAAMPVMPALSRIAPSAARLLFAPKTPGCARGAAGRGCRRPSSRKSAGPQPPNRWPSGPARGRTGPRRTAPPCPSRSCPLEPRSASGWLWKRTRPAQVTAMACAIAARAELRLETGRSTRARPCRERRVGTNIWSSVAQPAPALSN